jgi:hypothetical protein
VVDGQEFDIIVRRIATRRLDIAAGTGRSTASTNPRLRTERYIVGSFQVKLPVKTRELMLPAEETTLAIFKARLAETSPRSAWHPVLVRYIELVSGRVDGLGGNANAIPPSLHGHT